MLQHLWQAMSGRLFLHAGSACLEPCGVRMIQMNYVIMSIMSTCMSALCRHVTKNKSHGVGWGGGVGLGGGWGG